MKTRIYISGAITGTDDYMLRFARAQKKLEAQGYDVINPAAVSETLGFFDYEEYMDLDFYLLDKCIAIYMLDGWEKSMGANREYGYARAKELIIFKEKDGII